MTHPRYVCIHGHFYQPPRENPWLEAIELQESAEPYHDWNERITAECYSPNSASRIQTNDGHIVGIINNYARMSFNFGPTLLSWMEYHSPLTYQAILDADRESMERFGGHGSAMAQVYNHIIMPLANRRDQETQIVWGIRDFEHRFKRKPDGMWLAEAAVSVETLELLANHGIKFTVLAPNQAAGVRPKAQNGMKLPDVGWEDASGDRVDPARAYQCPLPNGKSIALFFYDGPISQAVAFEGILKSGETFAERLLSGFSDNRDYPQLLHIATDGETYGHHHKFGDMALAYALHYIETNNLAQLTNYAQFLELEPPTWEARIVNNSSWSCAHGIERWASDCGCSSGMHHGWSQQWRDPLRTGLNWLRDAINPAFEKAAGRIFTDPWKARDAYVDVMLNRDRQNVEHFIATQTKSALSQTDLTTALRLMELQRQLMLMFTSCGWFFDEVSGLETVQIMQYASRAIQLAELCLGLHLEPDFIARLGTARSNIPDNRDGAFVYEKFVKPSTVDMTRVGAHYAVTSLFKPEEPSERIYAFTVERHDWQLYEAGGQQCLAIGRARVISNITYNWEDITFGVLRLGDHNLTAGVAGHIEDGLYTRFVTEAVEAFRHSDLSQVIRTMDQQLGGLTYSLGSLFKDERQTIIKEILRNNLEQAEATLRLIYDNNASFMRFLTTVGAQQPEIFRAVGRFVIAGELRRLLEEDVTDPSRVLQLVDDAKAWNLPLDGQGVQLALDKAIEHRARNLMDGTEEAASMQALMAMGTLAVHLPYNVNFWLAQNVIFRLAPTRYNEKLAAAATGDKQAADWVSLFKQLAQQQKVNLDD